MKKPIFLIIAFCSIAFIHGTAFGLTLSLEPSFQDAVIGNPFTVDLNISGLTENLGAFGVEILFDKSILAFNSAEFGPYLGDPDFFEADRYVDDTFTLYSGVLVDEESFLTDSELSDPDEPKPNSFIQPSSFTLATLTFTGIGLGTSFLDFGYVDLSDADFPANTIYPDDFETASVTVTGAPVPEPATMLLLGTGILGLGIFGRQKFRK